MALSAMNEQSSVPSEQIHLRRYSGLKSPKQVGISAFYRLVNDQASLRFSFVRNPYDRLVSAWVDKFRNKPLVAGDSYIETYLENRKTMDLPLPKNADRSLSFADFVYFASATADRRIDAHWQLQDDLLNMPGIKLDFIGKVETFSKDFARIMKHVGTDRALVEAIKVHFNKSQHQPWRDYYTSALADQAYRAYERDFDRLLYPRVV
jgi:sulfotransferase famil protein